MVTFLSQGVLVTSSYKNFSESEVTIAKSDEPNKWKIHNVYDNIANEKLGDFKKITKISYMIHLHGSYFKFHLILKMALLAN